MSKRRNVKGRRENMAALIQCLSHKDPVELFEIASSGELEKLFPLEDDKPPTLGRWSELLEKEKTDGG